MKVKKYVASTMPEALQLIRDELGSDAVILHSKEMKRNGFLGFFKKKKIEVIAAIDPQPIQKKSKPLSSSKVRESIEAPPKIQVQKNIEQENILTEIKNLKKIVELQSSKIGVDLTSNYRLVLNHLVDQEVEIDIAEDIIHSVMKKVQDEESLNNSDMKLAVQEIIKEKVEGYSYKGITDGKKIIQFVGPTGVGKTTTIAKIAAKLMLEEEKKVAFITTDTYRIAAIDQLKTYARILNIPLEVAYNVEDYEKAIEKLSAYDLILVDTAGRNFRDKQYIQELQDTFGDHKVIATYLVLSLTAKPKDINDIYDQFYQIPLEAVIFTKIDETKQYGSILNIILNKNIGIAYVTNGQDVPDNILHLSAHDISKLIVGEQDD